jgi:hypothetical protein
MKISSVLPSESSINANTFNLPSHFVAENELFEEIQRN